MSKGEHRRVRLRTLTFALLAAATVAVGTAWPAHASNDPLFGKQWGLQVANVPAAWSRSTGAGIRIGIVDTGVHLAQEDLAGKVVESANCINSNGNAAACSGNAQDDNGHGTHVSGIAAANKDNGRGIAGVAPGASLVVAKVLDGNGSGSTADVEAGIRWVVQHGARVVNLSLGDDPIFGSLFSDPSFPQTINDAYNAGAIPVVAAGNEELLFCSAPYGGLNALVVGALGHTGGIAGYSCPIGSAKWGVMAPGGDADGSAADDVWSTWWDKSNPGSTNSYAPLAGTSMATPHVSGMAALLLAEGLTRDAVIQRITGTAVGVPGCSGTTCGHGRIDVTAAVGTGSGGGPAAGGGGGGAAPASNAGAATAPKIVKPSKPTLAANGTTTTGAPTTTTGAPGAAAVPGDNPVVAAGAAPHGATKHAAGSPSSRAGQVGVAIGLLGLTGLGISFAVLRLRGGGAL